DRGNALPLRPQVALPANRSGPGARRCAGLSRAVGKGAAGKRIEPRSLVPSVRRGSRRRPIVYDSPGAAFRRPPAVCAGIRARPGPYPGSSISMHKPESYRSGPDESGHFGIFGGRFVAETLMPLILEVERAWDAARSDEAFARDFDYYAEHYIGRPSPLYHARRLSE